MCTYNSVVKSSSPTFTGYKAVLVGDGRFFSACTLIEYKPGPVDADQVKVETLFYKNVIDPSSYYYNKQHCGRTAVFVSKDDARREDYNLNAILNSDRRQYLMERLGVSTISSTVVEMTIGATPELPDMFHGMSSGNKTVSGSNIISIKEI